MKCLVAFSIMTNPKAHYKCSKLFDKLNVLAEKV